MTIFESDIVIHLLVLNHAKLMLILMLPELQCLSCSLYCIILYCGVLHCTAVNVMKQLYRSRST